MRRGFTVIELLVILALFAVSALVLLSLSCDRERSKKSRAEEEHGTSEKTEKSATSEQEPESEFREYPSDSGNIQFGVAEKAQLARCKSNLRQLGMGLQIYVMDLGRNKYYPDTNGGGFLARLYQTELLAEEKCFACPSNERISEENIRALRAEDEGNVISYAGRKNAIQDEYPGLFKLYRDTSLTSVASDDWQGTSNHSDGKVIAVLYQDGHVDQVVNIYARGYRDYAMGQQEQYHIAHPLTN